MIRVRKKISQRLTLDPLWWSKVPEGLRPAVDLGCGDHKSSGSWGMDIRKTSKTDIVCDINKGYLPIKSSSIKLLYASHIIEHVEDAEKMLSEIYRVCMHEAHVLIRYPHFRSINAYSDITHKRYLGFRVFDNYIRCPRSKPYYNWFLLKKRGVRLKRWLRRIGVELLLSILLPKIEGWAFLLPFYSIDVFVHLEVIKENF